MKKLLKNADIVDVFTDSLIHGNLLIENEKIIGIGSYTEEDADLTEDLSGKFICPGFIDSHIHIESSMMIPEEFAKVGLRCGTTTLLADPHEIANVCGKTGIQYMLQAGQNLPLHFYWMVPSCVPATSFDESGAVLSAEEIPSFYNHPKVLGLAEMMNYPGVIQGETETCAKILQAQKIGKRINGHAPALTGKDLDAYISAGIYDDHECATFEEACEKMSKGQWIMIRQGSSAKNLRNLMPLFDSKYNHRCCFCTDDKNAADLIDFGHIDSIVRQAVQWGANPLAALRMASFQAAQCIGLSAVGAIAPGYTADLLVLDDLATVKIRDVYISGRKFVDRGVVLPFSSPVIDFELQEHVQNTFKTRPIRAKDFHIQPKGSKCRIISLIENELLTKEWITELNFDHNNGIDTSRDILKLAVIERHHGTGHIGLGYVHGFGLKKGAVATSIAHDSHNLIVMGTNDEDLAAAAERILQLKGGIAVVCDGEVCAEIPLPIAGLMSDQPAEKIAEMNRDLRTVLKGEFGIDPDDDMIMHLAFLSLPVIPKLKMTTQGLFDVAAFQPTDLFVKD